MPHGWMYRDSKIKIMKPKKYNKLTKQPKDPCATHGLPEQLFQTVDKLEKYSKMKSNEYDYLPSERSRTIKITFLLPKRVMCFVLWLLKFIIRMTILKTSSSLSPFRDGLCPWFDQTLLHLRMLCVIIVKIGPVVLEVKLKMWRVYWISNGRSKRQKIWINGFSTQMISHTPSTVIPLPPPPSRIK